MIQQQLAAAADPARQLGGVCVNVVPCVYGCSFRSVMCPRCVICSLNVLGCLFCAGTCLRGANSKAVLSGVV